jgi:hypothetical protein
MKRKYSDPLVFSGILLNNSGTIGPVSPGQSGTFPDNAIVTEPETFSMNASGTMMTAEPPQIEILPAEEGTGSGTSVQDPVGEFAETIADPPAVLDEVTGDDTASDTTESGS